MHFSAHELSTMVERATSLGERLADGWCSSAIQDPIALRRLDRWRHLAGEGQPQQLAALLGSSGREPIPDSVLLGSLGSASGTTDHPLPEWADLLNSISAHIARTFKDHAGPHGAHGTGSIPYEHLYWPVAGFAWGRVAGRHPSAESLLGGKARRGLQGYLLQRMAGIASLCLHPLFLAHKSFASSGMMQLLFGGGSPSTGSGSAARLYASFVAELGEDGLRPLFTRFPVVARLAATVTLGWINFVGEFLQRLHADRGELERSFGIRAVPGCLRAVKAGVSDPHHGGSTVLILEFSGGQRLVYKPRPLAIDRAFYRLVREINERLPGLDLGVLKVLDRDGYGWVEFARRAPCSDKMAARRYHRRAGFLAYLVHWLQGIDFHRENVVAAGEHPMLVDLECLAHPLRLDETASINNMSASALSRSVLRTGLLPMWQSRVVDGALYDNSGFNGPVSRKSFLPVLRWERNNTDAMGWVHKAWHHRHRNHRPVLDGRLLSITTFERDVLVGYRAAAALLEGPGGSELCPCRRDIYEADARRIKRPTLVYGLLMRQSLEPAVLSEGVDRSIELMGLSCAAQDQDWTEEISSLERLDVPYFRYAKGSKILPGDARTVPSEVSSDHQESVVKSAVRRRVKLEEGKIRVLDKPKGLGGGPFRTVPLAP